MVEYFNRNRILLIGIASGLLIGTILSIFPFIEGMKIIIGIASVIIIFLKAESGLFIIALTLPLVPFRYVFLLSLMGIASFILKIVLEGDFKFKNIPMRYSAILFIIPLIFAAFTSVTFKQSIIKLLVYAISFLFLLISINLIDSKERLYKLIIVLIIAATIVGIYGLYQYRIGIELREDSWIDKETNPDVQTRVVSTFDNPNILAEYLILTIPLTLAFLWNTKNIFKKILFLLSLAVQILCILLTFSRGGWLGLLLAMLIFAIIVDGRLLLFYILGMIGLLAYNPKAIMGRISTIGSMEDSSNIYRIPLWMATIDMIKKFKINGVGLGMSAFHAIYPRYMRQGIIAVHSHNTFLQLLTELGIFGFIGFIMFIFDSLRIKLITIAKGMDMRMKRISAAAFASMMGILLHGLVDYIFFNDRIILMVWILISIGTVGYLLEFNDGEN